MNKNAKGAAVVALLWALWPKKAAKKTPPPPTEPQNERPDMEASIQQVKAPARPEATKRAPQAEPRAEDDDVARRVRERLEAGQRRDAKKPKGAGKPKPRRATKEEQKRRDESAEELADRMHATYIQRGFEPEVAAADALTLYLLAGGQNTAKIAYFQKLLGLPETGGYDFETREKITQLLDVAVDRAVSHYRKLIFDGEDPAYAAADALAVYVREQQADPTIPLPVERVAALQIQFMVPSGQYDDATREELNKKGIVAV